MSAPAGYVPLDLVGFTDKGAYESENTYAANDIVHDDNKMYRSLQDNNTGHALPVTPETETEWWELWLSGGAGDLEAITVKDTSNVTGGGAGKVVVAQTLIDAIAQKVLNDLIAKTQIVNNLLATQTGNVLDATQGKALDEKITQLNSKFILSGDAESIRMYNEGGTLMAMNMSYNNGEQYSFVILADRIQLNHYDGAEWKAVWSIPTSS